MRFFKLLGILQLIVLVLIYAVSLSHGVWPYLHPLSGAFLLVAAAMSLVVTSKPSKLLAGIFCVPTLIVSVMWLGLIQFLLPSWLAFIEAKELQERGSHAQAIKLFDKAIALTPTATAYLNRGQSYYSLGQYQTALEDWSKALLLEPKYALAYSNRAAVYCLGGNYQAALSDCTKAIALSSKDARPYINRADVYKHLALYQKAVDDGSKAITLASADPQMAAYALSGRGAAYSCMCKFQAALSDCTRAIELNPGAAGPYVTRTSVCNALALYEQSVDNCTKALELDPNSAEPCVNRATIYLNRAEAYDNIGQFKKADADRASAYRLEYGHCADQLRVDQTYVWEPFAEHRRKRIELEALADNVESARDISELQVARKRLANEFQTGPISDNRVVSLNNQDDWPLPLSNIAAAKRNLLDRIQVHRESMEHLANEEFLNINAWIVTYLDAGKLQVAQGWAVGLLPVCFLTSDPGLCRAMVWWMLGYTCAATGEYDEGCRFVDQALDVFQERGRTLEVEELQAAHRWLIARSKRTAPVSVKSDHELEDLRRQVEAALESLSS